MFIAWILVRYMEDSARYSDEMAITYKAIRMGTLNSVEDTTVEARDVSSTPQNSPASCHQLCAKAATAPGIDAAL